MKSDWIDIFIPSYHRPDNCLTVKYFKRLGWDSSRLHIFVDDEADDIDDYRAMCEKNGCQLVIFSMAEARARYDYVHRASPSRRSAGQARNMFQDYAQSHGITFYCVQDDDTTAMNKRLFGRKFAGKSYKRATLSEVRATFLGIREMMMRRHIGVFGLSQSGDLIGGLDRNALLRHKVMNTTFYLLPYIYRGERGVQDDDTSLFTGVMNAGLFSGSLYQGIILHQMPSAEQSGGLTDLYNECKLLNKSLVVPIQFPSAVYAERQAKNGGRLHHHIEGKFLEPRLLRNIGGRDNIAWDTYPEDTPFTNEPPRKK